MLVQTCEKRMYPEAARALLQQHVEKGDSEHGVFQYGFVLVVQRGGVPLYEVYVIWMRAMGQLMQGEQRIAVWRDATATEASKRTEAYEQRLHNL